MKKLLLIPLLLGFISAVNAESYWLVLHSGGNGKALEKIEMESMKQCKEQGELFKNFTKYNTYVKYICLTGK